MAQPTRRAQNYACPIRDVLDRIGDAWSVLILLELDKGPCHFNALRRVIDGISQRMLAVTLRNLERDGFVHRRVLPLSPPRVEYSLTPLGTSLRATLETLRDWADAHQPSVRDARRAFDARAEPAPAP